MKSKYLLVLAPFVLAGCNLLGGYGAVDTEESGEAEVQEDAMMKDKDGAMMEKEDGAMMEEGVVEVALEASNFTFGREEIRVKKGETVRVSINNTQGTHDFVIDEFEVNSGIIPTGSAETVEFVADQTGSYEYYCSVGNHRQLGMKGILVVE